MTQEKPRRETLLKRALFIYLSFANKNTNLQWRINLPLPQNLPRKICRVPNKNSVVQTTINVVWPLKIVPKKSIEVLYGQYDPVSKFVQQENLTK